jgi:hypothetical protein
MIVGGSFANLGVFPSLMEGCVEPQHSREMSCSTNSFFITVD